ncbi:type IV toxin-antitoxin system AbiEi family antitoxin domain-containing protein [Cellulomonas phragmiteti]|nr:type IV toxin-antitoxin system AbiEi family antitoxin domain-containing protein [Cellulomonas phragmiteti]
MARAVDPTWTPPAAAARRGVFTRAEALAAGLTEDQVRHRIESGVWRRVCGAGLVLATTPPGPWLDAHAAVVTWPGATLALTSAALVHGMPVPDDGRVHVVVTGPRARRGRLVPHRHALTAADRIVLAGVDVTGRARTAVDCLGWLSRDGAARLLAWVGTRRILGADDLDGWVRTHPGHRGNAQRTWCAERLRSGALSVAEERLQDLLRGAGVAGWTANAPLLDTLGVPAVVDVWFADVRLVVEVDGRVAHGPDRFQGDRTRQNLLVRAGCTVLRYTWDDLTRRSDEVVAQILATLHRLRATR